MNTNTDTALDMEDSLDFDLDANLDDVEDIIDFQNPVDGSHVLRIGDCSIQKVGKEEIPMVVFTYQHVRTITQVNADEPASAVGSLFSERFGGNKQGKAFLKKRMKQLLGDALQGMSIRDQMQAVNDNFRADYHVQATTKIVHKDGYDNLRIQRVTAIEAEALPEGYKVWEPKAD